MIVTAFSVNHGSWPNAFGYKFLSDDRTIVISGDTRPSESIVEQCNGCDVLIHEVYSQAGFATRAPEWQRYHASFHTSTYELAELANRARPQLLILYHQLLWGQSEEQLLAEIRERYDGRVVWGRDLQVYLIGRGQSTERDAGIPWRKSSRPRREELRPLCMCGM